MAETIQTAANVTLIPARGTRTENPALTAGTRLRVAAYCRVSTDEEQQQNSYATQVSYYTDFISSNPDWQLVGIFADEGISGTQTANRTEFNKMIKLARRHKIDLILCKSISRFARNTVDCLDYVRELKSLGVNVKFEKENIETLSASSEFAISLYASFAQAESESISKNVTWGIEKAFQEGKVRYRLNGTLGYRMGDDGKPYIVEDEAVHVRTIFRMFAEGHSMKEIADYMMELGVERRNGSTEWTRHHVNCILRNEKYVGDAILQKSYTVDCLTHKRAKNTGQKAKYLIQDCHEAIIDRETWDRVRLELAKRSMDAGGRTSRKQKGSYHTDYCFNQILICPYCGSTFKRTIWKIGDRNVGVWRCGTRLEHGSRRCAKSPSVHESKLHKAVLSAVNHVIEDVQELNEAVMTSLEKSRAEIISIDAEYRAEFTRLKEIENKRDGILEIITGSTFDRFREELKTLNSSEEECKKKLEELTHQKEKIQHSIQQTTSARELFANMRPLVCFDDVTVRRLVERIEVINKTTIKVVFRGGLEYQTEVEK